MSSGNQKTRTYQPLSKEWLYKKPPLKTRTQPEFDPSAFLRKNRSPSRTKGIFAHCGQWVIKQYNKNPTKATLTVLVGGIGVLYSHFIYAAFVRPVGQLAFYAKDAMFPTTLVPIEDEDDD